jgi:large subunit ribosomal protein L11
MANPAPPLGSQLGQVGINIASFVKDFNLRTSIYKEGVPLPCYVTVNPDRTYNLAISHPPWPYFIMQAAGIQRGAMLGRIQVAGKAKLFVRRDPKQIKHYY